MLTRDLVRASVRKDEIRPSLIDPDKPAMVEATAELAALFDAAVEEGWRRGDLDDAIAGWIGDRRDVKLLRGLAKIALDATTFQVDSPLPPRELRDRVFRRARAMGPLALEPGPLARPTAEDVLDAVASDLGCEREAVREALYADLREQERVVRHMIPEPGWIGHRYNLALLQALLLLATDLHVTLPDPSAPRLRQLARAAKFHRLMVGVERHDDALTLTLDGPAALFSQSTRYGLELASFLHTLIAQDCRWTARATVLWTRANQRKTLTFSSEDGLTTDRPDTGTWRTREQEAFEERFAARASDWTLDPIPTAIPLGDRQVLVPDFTLVGPDGRRAHLEIVGYWTAEDLAARFARLERYGPGSVVVAVSRKRRASKNKDIPTFSGPVIPFAEVVPVAEVLEAAAQVAR